jgi:hypothetical protein
VELGFIHRYLPAADPSSGTTLLLLHGTGVCMIVGLVMTLVYIYPINDILFIKAGGRAAILPLKRCVAWPVNGSLPTGCGLGL